MDQSTGTLTTNERVRAVGSGLTGYACTPPKRNQSVTTPDCSSPPSRVPRRYVLE